MSTEKNDITQVLTDLDAGTFAEKASAALTRAAKGTIEHSKKSQVVITLDMEQIGNSNQISVRHKLQYASPTARGKVTEEDTTTTPMHVSPSGGVSIYPARQDDLFGADRPSEEHA